MRKTIALVAAAFALASTLALATPADEASASVAVTFADLDLTTPTGAATLDSRVENAAERVCARPHIRDIKAMQAFDDCVAEARDSAMEQLSLANPFDGIELASAF